MNAHVLRSLASMFGMLSLAACASTSANPTGLAGGQIMCPSGPRPILDCRGLLQQYARDFKVDVSAMSQAQVGLGLTSTKLTEADALTSDLLQHSYQICTLYNACIIPPQEYAAKSEKLQAVQMQIRRALGPYGANIQGQQQNIQINPATMPAPMPAPGPTSPMPATPQGGMTPDPAQSGAPTTGGAPAPAGDTILTILRDGSSALRAAPTAAAQTPPPPITQAPVPGPDLDGLLRGMLQSLRQDVTNRNPALAAGRAVVGNFSEEGRPWGGPVGALLQEHVTALVVNEGIFKQATGVQARGVSIKEVSAVKNVNDPKALTDLYGMELAIVGTYQTTPDFVALTLVALQGTGEVARIGGTIPRSAIPDVVATAPQNAAETGQLIDALAELGPRADGKVNLTTSRPGAGVSYRLGEPIVYYVGSSSEGFLYVFYVDGDKNITRLFPNQFQRDARIAAGRTLQLPPGDATYRFEATPPFGLETTFAIVTPAPFDERDLQRIEASLRGAKQDLRAAVTPRGVTIMRGSASGPGGGAPSVLWNSVTVLIRP